MGHEFGTSVGSYMGWNSMLGKDMSNEKFS
jgi:hypothetical protein